ncbi:uncharacterized protein I206_102431 [Kwoniella pini CBS 10737]|uniref:MIPC synthase n=1 Tax=Kwoniella pini CBS 10737 TaxID=1296096 RepID=A0A1B9I5B8_9TREE|nr:MIPC synthase [Kwoniella pini CBS 10737]OCF50724.1 MIPC synthase [Kwoniella pini CBS 10737]
MDSYTHFDNTLSSTSSVYSHLTGSIQNSKKIASKPTKRSSISEAPFITSSLPTVSASSSKGKEKEDSIYRSRTTSISLVGPSSPTSRYFNGLEQIHNLPISNSLTSSESPPTTSSSSSSASSSFYSPQNPRRRVSLSISTTSKGSNPYASVQIQPVPSSPRRSRTMSYSRISSSSNRNERSNPTTPSKKSSSKTRKIIISLLVILSLFLIGTVIVLSSVSYYLGIPNWAYLTESEVSWRPSDTIKSLKDPSIFNESSSLDENNKNRRRKEWRDVTDDLATGGILETSGVLGTDTLPDSWKELEEEMEELDQVEESDEPPTYVDSVETTAESENDQLDENAEQTENDLWGIDGKGSGGYWMQKDWNGKVENTKSWNRLFNVTNRPGETIPRIIHQTWKSDVLPEKWQKAWKECREGMPDYEYMLWTDDLSREFVAKHYPAHLHMFDSYEYPIQRADSIRYFILHHFGGIYMDLDIGCRRRLDPLLQGDWEVILPITKPVGVSNDLIFSSKGSAFMDDTVHGLSTFNHRYFTNYPTVMFSTGPMFLSAQYALYSSAHPLTEIHPRAEVRILPKSLYGKNAPIATVPHSFFSHFYGSSWHADDAGFITFLGAWGKKLMWVGLVVLILGVIRLIWIKRKSANGQQYQLLSILPTTSSGNGHRSGSSTPTSSSSNPMSPSTTFDLNQLNLPNDIANVFKRAGNLILAAPATLLHGNNDANLHGGRRRGGGGRRKTGLLYFVPALFQPDNTRRRPRTASEASQLPLRVRSKRDKPPPPPPYETDEYPIISNNLQNQNQNQNSKNGEMDGMEEVDQFLNEISTEGGSSSNTENEVEFDGDWEDWRRKDDSSR